MSYVFLAQIVESSNGTVKQINKQHFCVELSALVELLSVKELRAIFDECIANGLNIDCITKANASAYEDSRFEHVSFKPDDVKAQLISLLESLEAVDVLKEYCHYQGVFDEGGNEIQEAIAEIKTEGVVRDFYGRISAYGITEDFSGRSTLNKKEQTTFHLDSSEVSLFRPINEKKGIIDIGGEYNWEFKEGFAYDLDKKKWIKDAAIPRGPFKNISSIHQCCPASLEEVLGKIMLYCYDFPFQDVGPLIVDAQTFKAITPFKIELQEGMRLYRTNEKVIGTYSRGEQLDWRLKKESFLEWLRKEAMLILELCDRANREDLEIQFIEG
ncbi:hypothetical protein FLL45_15610 [Aliikangiella marina]|uniref:Uncharacterized protein n=1 Tax=Aliikangiella marina TaxID=1712262 RepID=A0A545T6N9_9GAMM|nr:hypothetical protein [Aliikangiella marina]TQV72891.1 hypothetical protein FLL45_15610 [Aliikangiella marina]